MDNKHVKWTIEKYHPNERCTSSIKTGQCPNIKQNNTEFCMLHGANTVLIVQQDEIKRNYRLTRWKDRVEDFADNDQIKSLREEIGILRIVMEEILNRCNDSIDLMMSSQRICDVAMKIEKLVTSCDKLEKNMGMLLSKRAVIQLAGQFVQIIDNHISDPEKIEQISIEMVAAIQEIDIQTEQV